MADLPRPPFVDVPGIFNFRDIGGRTTKDGGRVKSGVVFRSADPCRATEDGMKKMSEDLGIKVIFDLRSTPEIQRDGPEWAGIDVEKEDVFEPYGIHRDWVPVFAEKDYGPEQIALRYANYARGNSDGFVQAYHDILLSAPQAYGKIFRHLADANVTPCLVNCTAGKDRTGVLIALILSLLGASTDDIADEYALTDLGLAERKPVFVERLLNNPALNGNREGVEYMVSSRKENMEAAIMMINESFGGAESYAKSKCGLSDDDIAQIRKNLKAEGDR